MALNAYKNDNNSGALNSREILINLQPTTTELCASSELRDAIKTISCNNCVDGGYSKSETGQGVSITQWAIVTVQSFSLPVPVEMTADNGLISHISIEKEGDIYPEKIAVASAIYYFRALLGIRQHWSELSKSIHPSCYSQLSAGNSRMQLLGEEEISNIWNILHCEVYGET